METLQGQDGSNAVNISGLIKKRFDIAVAGADTPYVEIFELDKSIKSIRGLLLTSDRDDLLYYRGSQKIEISRLEIFPDGYESKLLMSGINCSPNDRYFELGEVPVGNAQVKVTYQDTSDGRTQFAAYRVSLYLDCELNQ
jgi:hypothetical protein